jgi:glyoxylase-like metal-dependent hydrolase (beta-lactamase superfamily II)
MRRYEGPAIVPALQNAGFDPATVDVVAMSHLHFDHAGGLLLADGTRAFPRASIVAQRAEWEIALGGNSRLVASYDQPEIRLVRDWGDEGAADGEREVLPGVSVVRPAATAPATRRSSSEAAGRRRRRSRSSATSACGRGPRTRAG